MLKELKFVQGAVSKKDFLPAMTHFAIEAGTVRAYNGLIALGSPLPCDIDCKPKADALVRAIANCTETVTLSMTPTGRLRVQSGKFRAFIDCVQEETPHVRPEGDSVSIDGEALLKAIQTVYPFVGDDASRPWTNGILLKGQSAFATNNVTLVEYWVGQEFPSVVNIPKPALKEVLRIGEPPEYVQLTDTSLTFHYSDGRWVRTQLFSTEWPDLSPVLDRSANVSPINKEIFEGLGVIKPFADKLGRVFIRGDVLSTSETDGEGASYEVEGLDITGIYQIEMISLLASVAQQVDFTSYPQPCIFYGDRLRGAIVGMRP